MYSNMPELVAVTIAPLVELANPRDGDMLELNVGAPVFSSPEGTSVLFGGISAVEAPDTFVLGGGTREETG